MTGKQKKTLKMTVDTVMTALLLCLMAYQITGEKWHEWIGVGMTVLLIFHHVLNGKWYKSLFRGKYHPYRAASTGVNTLLLISIALTAVCGMSMSAHAVPFLYGILPLSFARRFHLSMSYWSFILMGVHLGLHIPAMTAGWKMSESTKKAVSVAAPVLGGIGLWRFLVTGIPGYLFFRSPFAFFDYGKSAVTVFAENLTILLGFAFLGTCCASYLMASGTKGEEGSRKREKPEVLVLASLLVCAGLLLGEGLVGILQATGPKTETPVQTAEEETSPEEVTSPEIGMEARDIDDGYVFISGGNFLMGSPETENWRIGDELQHEVSVSSFYIDPYETTQAEYRRVMGEDPSFFEGDDLPVESISWMDAVLFANAKSLDAGLTPVYTVTEEGVLWDRSAEGYRLPTETEWEYACRAGTVTPFNAERSLDARDANFYGHYPYEIEENYFDNSTLEAKPGEYRQTTVTVGSFYASPWGLYDTHGNVNEWCWDYYGTYDPADRMNPSGPETGIQHVYRGGGWNDFGKNMRSAYRGAGQSDFKAANLGVRLVRNAGNGIRETVMAAEMLRTENPEGKTLIVFFSWGGNTRGIAREIQRQTGADLFEIILKQPYSTNYNTVLMEAQEDQHRQARPEILDLPESIDGYDVILLGYPNWWASIPMPIATFLESYDFSGKTIVPFCSHGGGRFGQSLTAIAKLAPDAVMGEGLSVHYSGGNTLPEDVSAWLDRNGIRQR